MFKELVDSVKKLKSFEDTSTNFQFAKRFWWNIIRLIQLQTKSKITASFPYLFLLAKIVIQRL